MVHAKPRLGGGIKMDHKKNLQSVLPGQEFAKMEEKAIENVQMEMCASILKTREEDIPHRSSLKLTNDVVVDSNKELLQREGNHSPRFSSKAEQAKPEEYTGCWQINESHDDLTPSGGKQRYGKEETAVVARQKQNLTRLNNLIDNLETLGITTKSKLYTKLSDDQKQLWFRYFDDIVTGKLSNKFRSPQDCFTDPDLAINVTEIVYCKNLFLKDKKGQFYLVIAEESCSVDLKQLKQQLSVSRNLSFADEESLASILKLKPGEVTPFAIMHESARDVRVIFHESLSTIMNTNFPMAFHPFCPFLQIEVTFSELSLYFSHYGKRLEVLSQNKEAFSVAKQCKDSLKLTNKHKENVETLKQVPPSQSSQASSCPEDTIAFAQEKFDARCREEISADYFLRDTPKSDEGSQTRVFSPYEKYVEKEAVKHTKKIIVKNCERKGKLKSYVKKNAGRNDENLNIETENGSIAMPLLDANKDEDGRGIILMKHIASDEEIVATDKVNDEEQGAVSLYTLSPKLTLPEIEDFYNSLSNHKISYRELDVASTTSKDIGPALGVRCFLLKDRNKVRNYFLVICHELYELDYGRLKKALHPKKRLDECDGYEVMDILGVDQQHLTPFAIMNTRAGRNNVRVFFTQKIMPSNIILCIQHPFTQGNRILMMSDTLQCLIEKFSSDGFIGVIEEKVWVEKYNKIFSQFYATEFNQTSYLGRNEAKIFPPKSSDVIAFRNQGNNHNEKINEKEEQTKRVINSINCGVYSSLKNCVHSFYQVMINFGYYFPWKHSQPLEWACGDAGSPVDQEGFKHEVNNDDFSSDFEKKYELRMENGQCKAKEIQGSIEESFSSHRQIRHEDKFLQSSVISKREQDLNLKQFRESRDEVLNPLFHSLIEKEMKISINDIQHHLNENCIDYLISVRKDGYDEDKDDDKTSQMCHTLYLMDELGVSHYIIVGSESEHISMKRFCRRFQVGKRVFVVSENERFFGSNPFSTFLSIRQEQSENSNECKPKVKYYLVLHTSIYMDPEMECIFMLNHTGTSICLSSEDFENYGKRVGMEVWYMP